MAPSNIDEDFVNIFSKPASPMDIPFPGHTHEPKDMYSHWVKNVSAPTSYPIVSGADVLKRLHPDHSVVLTEDYNLNPLNFPNAQVIPLDSSQVVTNLFFLPFARNVGVPGLLVDNIEYGSFKIVWQQFEFLLYTITYPMGFGTRSQNFLLHEGPESVSRLFLSSVGAFSYELHEEIWVFNQGYWQKERSLWKEVQKADWKDVILKDEFKKALKKDIYGFFESEAIYKELAIPWKRGLIMHGPPGNGKTISLKAIMKSCDEKGFVPLYVRSFQSWQGEEAAMSLVFNKARQLAPCVVILEDLDSLINDQNRSFFLNQLDGLEGNDGLLIIGTTNHFDKLDPGISTRPSRFDRKFLFDDPDEAERKLYAQYWQRKLKSNKDVKFDDKLVDDYVSWTDRFSFAYLKESFVSSLVLLAGAEGDKPAFKTVLKDEVNTLRKQLDKTSVKSQGGSAAHRDDASRRAAPRPQRSNSDERDIRSMLDSLSEYASRAEVFPNRVYALPGERRNGQDAARAAGERNIRDLLDSLSESPVFLERLASRRTFDLPSSEGRFDSSPRATANDGERNYRDLLDRVASNQNEIDAILSESRRIYSSLIPPAVPRGPVSQGVWPQTPHNAQPQFAANPGAPQMNSPFGGMGMSPPRFGA